MEKTIIVMYFSFTSLSTVGFGDFEPVADAERLVGAFVLLFGVSIFSYIMGIFIEILDQFRNMNEDYDKGDELDCFFSMLQKLNNGMPMSPDFKSRVEDLFHYKWATDKNQCVQTETEYFMLGVIPSEVQEKLYCSYMFNDFLKKYQIFFRFEKKE